MSRELRAMGYRKLSARPRHHAQAEGAIEAFKKPSRPAWRKSRAKRASIAGDIEVWFADEARDRPEEQDHPPLGKTRNASFSAADQRTASTYIFGAICPEGGQGGRPDPAQVQHRGDEPASGRSRQGYCAWRVTPSSCSIRRDGIPPASSLSRQSSPSCPCPAKCPELNPQRTSGSSCATIGCPTASSITPTTSSITAAKPGTSSSPTLAHHVHRNARLGPQVLINASWYKWRRARHSASRLRAADRGRL